MQLYLIRHAQSSNNASPDNARVEDAPLTDLGHRQAIHLAQWIPSLKLTRLLSSPFLRTLQTTDHIRQTVALKPQISTQLHELGGCVEGPTPDVMVGRPGMTRSEIESRFPAFDITPDIDGRGWWRNKPYETREEARGRAAKLLAQIRQELAETDERLGCVTHGGFTPLLITCFDPTPREVPHNASVARIDITQKTIRLNYYDRVEQLPANLITQ